MISHLARIREDCTICSDVTIGVDGKENKGAARIGNYVVIGSGARIIGNVVIADNVTIGADAVVCVDVLEGILRTVDDRNRAEGSCAYHEESNKGEGSVKKSVFWLKAMACILITNSHMGGLYPQSLRALSFGGYLGNCLFFGIAGYLLAYCRKDSVAVFLKKRVLRIYIPYLLVLPFVINAGSYLGLFELVFPIQNFHFLPSIITLYPVFYLALLLADKIGKKGLPIILVGVYALQLVYYVTLYQFQYPLFTHYKLLPMLSYF